MMKNTILNNKWFTLGGGGTGGDDFPEDVEVEESGEDLRPSLK